MTATEHAADVLQAPGGQSLDEPGRRGAGAQADLHAARHVVVDGLVADLLLELVLRRHGRDGYGLPR